MKKNTKCGMTLDFLDEKPWISNESLPLEIKEHLYGCRSCQAYMKVSAGIKAAAETKETVHLLGRFHEELHHKQELKSERNNARWAFAWTGSLAALILFAGISWNIQLNKNNAARQVQYTTASSSSSEVYQEVYDGDSSDLKYIVQISLSM